jgi:hypothetical protein
MALSAYGAAAKGALDQYHSTLKSRDFKRARGLYLAMVKAVEGDTRPPRKLISIQEAIAAGK